MVWIDNWYLWLWVIIPIIYLAVWKEHCPHKQSKEAFKSILGLIGKVCGGLVWVFIIGLVIAVVIVFLLFVLLGLSGLTTTTILIIIFIVWYVEHQEQKGAGK